MSLRSAPSPGHRPRAPATAGIPSSVPVSYRDVLRRPAAFLGSVGVRPASLGVTRRCVASRGVLRCIVASYPACSGFPWRPARRRAHRSYSYVEQTLHGRRRRCAVSIPGYRRRSDLTTTTTGRLVRRAAAVLSRTHRLAHSPPGRPADRRAGTAAGTLCRGRELRLAVSVRAGCVSDVQSRCVGKLESAYHAAVRLS